MGTLICGTTVGFTKWRILTDIVINQVKNIGDLENGVADAAFYLHAALSEL